MGAAAETPQLILASSSPRRAELLGQLRLAFVTRHPEVDERVRPGEAPTAYVERLARDKVMAGRRLADAALPVLAADTSVVLDGEPLGKPVDAADGAAMLRRLSGRRHDVLCAIAVAPARADAGRAGDAEDVQSRVIHTRVTFRVIDGDEIRQYWATGEPADKAGGYGIQGIGGIFVARLQGSYTAVMGLPVAETESLLRGAGVETWSQRYDAPACR